MKRPRPKYQVFVSSTYRDLSAERERVIWGILNARHIPAGMENFTAASDRGWEIIRRVIDVSDYYVVILAGMYGTVDPSTGISWTQREYEYAVSKGVPVLGFIREDARITQDKVEKDVDLRAKFETFKGKLKAHHLIMYWTDAEDLARKVVESIRNHINDDEDSAQPRPGWYRGDALEFSPNVVDEIARLSSENNDLRRQIEAVNASKKIVFELVDKSDAQLAEYAISRTCLLFQADDSDHSDFNIRALSVFGEPSASEYEHFMNKVNRSLLVELKIKNVGNTPAKSVVADLAFTNCKNVMLESLEAPQPKGLVAATNFFPKWKTDPNEHAYIDSYTADGNVGLVRQRIKMIAPGISERLVPFRIQVHDADENGWSSVCSYSITDSEGTNLNGTFRIEVRFDKRERLNKKQIAEKFRS